MTSTDRSIEAPPSGSYRIDTKESRVALTTKHLFGLATVRSTMSLDAGELVVSDDLAASHASVTASAASLDSGDARRDRAVRSVKFLDVENFPSLHFTSTAVTSEDGHWVVAGVLTARGVEAPLRLVVSDVQSDAAGLTVQATGRVDRYEHGITAMRGMAGRFSDLHITARAVRTTSAH